MSSGSFDSKVRNKCSKELGDFFDKAISNLCRSEEEVRKAFSDFSIKMINGIALHNDRELSVAALKLAEAVTEAVGSNQLGIETVREGAFRAFADCIKEIDDLDNFDFNEKISVFRKNLIDQSTVFFDFAGPCEIFRFEEGSTRLISKNISILPAKDFLDQSNIPKSGKDWVLVAGDGNWLDRPFISGDFQINGQVWWIKSHSPKDLAAQNAQWMADVFMSAVRLGLRQADYCLRPKIGKIEATPFSRPVLTDRQFVFNDNIFHVGGPQQISQYKVDPDFEARFVAEEFQKKLDGVLSPIPKSLGERLGNALGWCTRGRQAKDNSERLLYFFTSIESLLSEQSGFAHVSDSIARYISVILSDSIESREATYAEVKKLYGLRSELVHRGHRNAHWLNANNIQHTCETMLYVVWDSLDFDIKHSDFIQGLKAATHGTPWPTQS